MAWLQNNIFRPISRLFMLKQVQNFSNLKPVISSIWADVGTCFVDSIFQGWSLLVYYIENRPRNWFCQNLWNIEFWKAFGSEKYLTYKLDITGNFSFWKVERDIRYTQQPKQQSFEVWAWKKNWSFEVFYFSTALTGMNQPCAFRLSNGRI